MHDPVLLHISDIHRTPDEPASTDEILHSLCADFDRFTTTGVPAPNVVVVTGDLTQGAIVKEYDEAEVLLRGISNYLSIPLNRFVVVPGNHDVNWASMDGIWKPSKQRPSGVPEELVVSVGGRYLYAPNEQIYQQRFENFRQFYRQLLGEDYPQVRSRQFSVTRISELGLTIVGFNSCDLNDDERREGRINANAIAEAAAQLTDDTHVRLAVWHHDLNWRQESTSDALDVDSARRLSERAFQLGLCGHTHRPAWHDAVNLDGLPLPIVAAGSLCAGARQRAESVPRAYNIISIRNGIAKVYTRTKDERTSPWRARASARPNGKFEAFFDVSLPTKEAGRFVSDSSRIRNATAVRMPTPFADVNAKESPREEVVREYVWTKAASTFNNDMPHIVLGPRGSGKTALMLSLSFEGRTTSSELSTDSYSVMRRIGLVCPMKIADISSFVGKGWMDLDKRLALFRGFLATVWAREMIRTLQIICTWSQGRDVEPVSEEALVRCLSITWTGGSEAKTFVSLDEAIREYRAMALSPLSDIMANASMPSSWASIPLMRGGAGPLEDAANSLARLRLFNTTKWFVLFDEVEHLNEWQQQVIYEFLGVSTERVAAKIATLPYAHVSALEHIEAPLVEGADYRELPVSLYPEMGTETEGTEPALEFFDIADGVWSHRLRQYNLKQIPLNEVWPETEFESVLKTYGYDADREELERQLISEFSETARKRAVALQRSNPVEFGHQYWRRYHQPFKFRLIHRLRKNNIDIPLYWGRRTLLRACDGNCRWFLQLADLCWRTYWSHTGLRALTPHEQNAVLRKWAKNVLKECVAFPSCGDELYRILTEIANRLKHRLYERKHISAEAFSVQTDRTYSEKQTSPIAVGIAHGYLVPRVETGEELLDMMKYPRADVSFRLGYPVAAAEGLPLRSGTTTKIGSLRQVSLPWWKP